MHYITNLLTGESDEKDGDGGEGSDIRCCAADGTSALRNDLRHPECLPILIPEKDPFYGYVKIIEQVFISYSFLL